MKFTKMMALILASCLLCCALVACNNATNDETESSAEDVDTVQNKTISLLVKADGETKYEGDITFSGYLGDAIELFTISKIDDSEGECFDEHGFLVTVCDITAAENQSWVAYFEDDGIGKPIGTVRTQSLKDKEDGCTVVLQLVEIQDE